MFRFTSCSDFVQLMKKLCLKMIERSCVVSSRTTGYAAESFVYSFMRLLQGQKQFSYVMEQPPGNQTSKYAKTLRFLISYSAVVHLKIYKLQKQTTLALAVRNQCTFSDMRIAPVSRSSGIVNRLCSFEIPCLRYPTSFTFRKCPLTLPSLL